jgi:type II secretion system protein J
MVKGKQHTFGFTLIEVLVAISVLGLLMTALMVAFNTAVSTVQDMQQKSEMMQNLRAATEQLHRELSQAIINNNRPDGEQVYFEIKQLSVDQSVLRFGCTTERGLLEVAYQIKEAWNTDGTPRWRDYELWRLNKTRKMWNYHEDNWPEINFDTPEAEPFAFGIISFRVKYWSTQRSRWVAGNWDSFQRNAMPRKIQVTISALPKQRAKEARNISDITQIKGVETFKVEITLPQSR